MSNEEVPFIWMDSRHSIPLLMGAQLWGVSQQGLAALGQAVCCSRHSCQELCRASPGLHPGGMSISCIRYGMQRTCTLHMQRKTF